MARNIFATIDIHHTGRIAAVLQDDSPKRKFKAQQKNPIKPTKRAGFELSNKNLP
jgi:hypothetical protein